ncbi:MAG: hypothetical protein M3347_17630, partial [Armatimonadota bacterium]|nr:hypothetical protein [Armatimonadota bacterium]
RIEPMKLLLETTIQLHRIADDTGIKQRINDELSDQECYTTSFVLREFLRTVIKDLAYIHTAIESLEAGADGRIALGNLDRFLASGKGNFSVRAARRERYVTAIILDAFPETKIPRGKLLRFLERAAQQWLEEFFEVPALDGESRIDDDHFLTGLDEQHDEMERWIQDHHPIPEPPPFPIGAAKFLDDNRRSVLRAEECVQEAKAREKDKNLLKVLGALKDDDGEYDFLGKLKTNTRGNWTLGDLLIALESPPDAHIYTTDKHYGPLCRALKKHRSQGYQPMSRADANDRI